MLGLVFLPLGQVVGWVAWVFLTFTTEIVRLTAQIPFASVPFKMEGWMVWTYCALLGSLTWWLTQSGAAAGAGRGAGDGRTASGGGTTGGGQQ